jgi:cell division protein FtsX
MKDNSNTTLYIVATIIILHFLVGFGYLLYKMTKKKD